MPLFLSHDGMDSYFGRWLKPNKHYKLVRPEHICDDLKNAVWWATEHDDMAAQIGVNARRFATRVCAQLIANVWQLRAGLVENRSNQNSWPR